MRAPLFVFKSLGGGKKTNSERRKFGIVVHSFVVANALKGFDSSLKEQELSNARDDDDDDVMMMMKIP